jgi:hypothetical protein
VFYDTLGIEGTNSCIKYFGTTMKWGDANSYCNSLGSGVHLLTSKQVSHGGRCVVGGRGATTGALHSPGGRV